ncbi:MAG: hypothetical protein WC211_12530 [Dehalococcoidia bacterium]
MDPYAFDSEEESRLFDAIGRAIVSCAEIEFGLGLVAKFASVPTGSRRVEPVRWQASDHLKFLQTPGGVNGYRLPHAYRESWEGQIDRVGELLPAAFDMRNELVHGWYDGREVRRIRKVLTDPDTPPRQVEWESVMDIVSRCQSAWFQVDPLIEGAIDWHHSGRQDET